MTTNEPTEQPADQEQSPCSHAGPEMVAVEGGKPYTLTGHAKMAKECERLEAPAYTPGPWTWWDSCSWRRLGTADQSTLIMEPTIDRSDNHPNLCFRNGGYRGPDATLMKAAPEMFEALIEVNEFLADLAQRGCVKDGVEGLNDWCRVQLKVSDAIRAAEVV